MDLSTTLWLIVSCNGNSGILRLGLSGSVRG